jgi:hypothetical protein
MHLVYEILLEIFKYTQFNSNPSSLRALLQLNRAYSDIMLTVLWAELNSLEPLLHLMPNNIIQRCSMNRQWRYMSKICQDRSTALMRLRLFLKFLQYQNYIDFTSIALWYRQSNHAGPASPMISSMVLQISYNRHRHTLSPLFACLTHLELSCTHDFLIAFLPDIIYKGLRTLTLPHDDVLFDSGW